MEMKLIDLLTTNAEMSNSQAHLRGSSVPVSESLALECASKHHRNTPTLGQKKLKQKKPPRASYPFSASTVHVIPSVLMPGDFVHGAGHNTNLHQSVDKPNTTDET